MRTCAHLPAHPSAPSAYPPSPPPTHATVQIDSADAITFLWTTTFPLGVYGPLVLPMLIVFVM